MHVFPLTMFNTSCQWVDIVLTKDDIRTLPDVVIIVDPTCVNLFPQSYATPRFQDLLSPMQVKPNEKLLWLTPHWSIIPFNNWNIWMSTQIG
jgi:hypothetical protein